MENKNNTTSSIQNKEEKKEFYREDIEAKKLTDPSEIAYFKTVRNEEIVDNCLLGNYDSNGDYKFTDGIVAELISVPKYIDYQTEDELGKLYYLTSFIGIKGVKDLKFQIRLKEDKSNPLEVINEATISLLETVKKVNGLVENTLITPFAVYKARKNEAYLPNMYAKFNIQNTIGNGDSKIVDSDIIKLILDKVTESKYKQGLYSDELEAFYKKFLSKRLRLLKLSGPYGKYVLRLFNLRMAQAEKFLNLNKKRFYRMLVQLLDMCEDMAKGNEQKQVHAKYPVLMQDFSAGYGKISNTRESAYQKFKNPEKDPTYKFKSTPTKSASKAKAATPAKAPAAGKKKSGKKEDWMFLDMGDSSIAASSYNEVQAKTFGEKEGVDIAEFKSAVLNDLEFNKEKEINGGQTYRTEAIKKSVTNSIDRQKNN